MSTNGGLLVFGDDGSAAADVAWLWVSDHPWPVWWAEDVTVTPPPFPPSSGAHPTPAEWESPHERRPFAESGLASVRHLLVRTDPRLLVVGDSGGGHLHALPTGSTTEWLLHHPPAPLAVARSAGPVRRVLACVDGSAHAQRAVEAFSALRWAGDTDVVVLGVHDGWANTEEGQAEALDSLAAAGITAAAREVPPQGAGDDAG